MKSKKRMIILACIVSTMLGAESVSLPSSHITALVPAGWSQLPAEGMVAILRGPGATAASTSRMTVTTTVGDPATTCALLRSSWSRIADGCQFPDDNEVTVGGRVWRRLQMRFAVGPAAFAQTVWIGLVMGKTVVVVLSALEDELSAHSASAMAFLATLRG
jgi:hypothetical protein